MSFQIISKKLPNSRIVWFASSNQWVHLEEPAWFILSLLKKGQSTQNISLKFSSKYKLPTGESEHFVKEITGMLVELEKPVTLQLKNDDPIESLNSLKYTPFATRNYLINKKNIFISYDSRISEYYIHPSLAHLETCLALNSDAYFGIFQHKEKYILQKKNNPSFTFTADNYSQLKRKLFIEVANIIYNKNSRHWMSFLHASGISNGKETILLSSASGSGKSTMAALLQARGLQLVSDDFIPMDASNNHAFPFPAAISVKKAGFSVLSPYYGNLKDENYNLYPYTHKSVRYLKPLPDSTFSYKSGPVRSLIFIRYNPETSCELTLLSIPDALKLFHEQSWVSHNADHARAFINWFVKLKCFRLDYSDNEKGIDAVMGRFTE